MNFSELSDDQLKKKIEELETEMNQKDLLQKTQKILLNSLYGCMGNQFFVFYNLAIAEAITVTGQYIVKSIGSRLENEMRRISGTQDEYYIYGDTDSVGIDMRPVVEKYLSKYPEDVQLQKLTDYADQIIGEKVIPDEIKKRCAALNAFNPDALKMGRENICNGALLIAKKKYVFSILDEEGAVYKKPKVKITGLDAKKGTFHQLLKDKLVESYQTILEKDQDALYDFIDDSREEFFGLSPSDIAKHMSVNNIAKYEGETKGIPENVKAALAHNRYIKEKNIQTRNYIQSGDKIKIVTLNMPNPAKAEKFAWVGDWDDSDFGELRPYVNFSEQFEKSLIAGIKNVTKSIGWDGERQVSVNLADLM